MSLLRPRDLRVAAGRGGGHRPAAQAQPAGEDRDGGEVQGEEQGGERLHKQMIIRRNIT